MQPTEPTGPDPGWQRRRRCGCRRDRLAIVSVVLLFAAVAMEGCSQPKTSLSNYRRDESAQESPWILATPNPVVAGRLRKAKTMLTWDTTEGFSGHVYVSVDGQPEKLLSSSDRYYFEPILQKGHTYEFRLYGYSRTSPLSLVKVLCK